MRCSVMLGAVGVELYLLEAMLLLLLQNFVRDSFGHNPPLWGNALETSGALAAIH